MITEILEYGDFERLNNWRKLQKIAYDQQWDSPERGILPPMNSESVIN